MPLTPKYRFTLFVTPQNSRGALASLYNALRVVQYTDYKLEIVDVQKEPDKAINISNTPLLIYHTVQGDQIVDTIDDMTIRGLINNIQR